MAARGARIAAGDADDRMDERKIAVALSISGRIVAAATPWARYVWATAGAISSGRRHLVDVFRWHAGVFAALWNYL